MTRRPRETEPQPDATRPKPSPQDDALSFTVDDGWPPAPGSAEAAPAEADDDRPTLQTPSVLSEQTPPPPIAAPADPSKARAEPSAPLAAAGVAPAQAEPSPPRAPAPSVAREEGSWRRELGREQPFPQPSRTPTHGRRDVPGPGARQTPGRATPPPRPLTPVRPLLPPRPTPPRGGAPAGFTREGTARRVGDSHADAALLGPAPTSSLETPRRLVDLGTGLPSLTSLFSDLKAVVMQSGVTVLYVHVPSSAIVEERFGWEALEAYRGLIANYLSGVVQDMRRDRDHGVVARAFADDFVIITAQRDHDARIASALADSMTRHLMAIDEETASLLQVYVGMAVGKLFTKVHPERFLYRLIQQAQTEATDVGRQKISAHVRVLDRCIAGELFTMVYQPIVHMEDHSIFAYEALARCSEKELRSAHVLFNVAEQGDRIWPLDRLLRRMALKKVSELPGERQMFVNLHPRDFEDPQILEPQGDIARTARQLVLEVTERAAILDLDNFRKKLATLRSFGARIAIDDLGSGYSALNLVAELNPDFIKLDMTLIRGIEESPVRQNLLRNIVAFATDLGARVVAEGVETRPELEALSELGCQLVQGFYLAVPSPPFVETITVPPAQRRTDLPTAES